MIVYILLLITLCLASWSCILWLKASGREGFARRMGWLMSLSLGVFVYLYGTWVYTTVYLKYAFWIVYCLVALYGTWKGRVKEVISVLPRWRLVLFVVWILVLNTFNILYFTGTTGTPGVVNLQLPFKKGTYYVLQGGKGLPTNFFHSSLRGAIYAMDIVKLDTYGRRADKIFSKDLRDYHIYNDTVYSPCAGIVARTESANPDNIPPNMNRGPKNTNQVLIETDSFFVFMGHLGQNKVFVKEGQYVNTGDPLGCVGNSGFSMEPHLHIQVHLKERGKAWYRGKPLYIEFDGKAYLLNDIIKRR
ncbi:hypothetical protein COR50_12125 [Chitinophaga caeni]|uniref:M23ase beta-sheet core domain-containing protein n=1 Tax=Chitinophaga caeni TaxID=2029983 RepID=A0A291QV86_9BACT|nr:M23 family metallopeptidase [Chitinophaga caeni]ATL47847.1 hypothetical protein COR50_12125 [Chitinophaga caeni]